MKILVGNDTQSTTVGLLSFAGQVQMLITGLLGVIAIQVPSFGWLWAILSATVVCILGIWRAWIGFKMNYLRSDPNIPAQDTPAVVNIQTTGPVPAAAQVDAASTK